MRYGKTERSDPQDREVVASLQQLAKFTGKTVAQIRYGLTIHDQNISARELDPQEKGAVQITDSQLEAATT